jgi:aminoglycoside phosphotransferase (APT) family kinase protein
MHHRGYEEVVVDSLSRPSAGYSSETIIAEVSRSEGDGRHRGALVIRMGPPAVGTFAGYDLVPQWQAQMAAAAGGVPVADPVLETDARWLGEPFIVMPKVDGHIVGALAHRDRWLGGMEPDRRACIYDGFLATLAAVHRADPDAAPAVSRRDNCAELAFWEEYLSWSTGGEPVATLVEALAWCRAHRPDEEPAPVLLWGDVRLENAVFDDDGTVLAVLDWDMTSIGAPEHDLAWLTGLDLTMHALFGTRTEGFPDRDRTVERFEELSGRPIRQLEWYETLAMVRSAAVMTRISVLRRDAGEPAMLPIADNPVLDLVRARLT